MQGELFELTVANLLPTSGTFRLRWSGIASDNWKYAIKRVCDHEWLPATEWFCHRLAEAVHLPTPVYRKLRLLQDGTLAFGSRWESAAKQTTDFAPSDRERLFQTGINVCRIIGLDLFLPNGDRHLNNYLWHLIDNTPTAQAFDYSEAWAMHGDLQLPPALSGASNTARVIAWLRSINAFRPNDVGEVIHRIRTLPAGTIERITDDIPPEWLPAEGKGAIIDWWSAPHTVSRLALLSAQYPCAATSITPSSA